MRANKNIFNGKKEEVAEELTPAHSNQYYLPFLAADLQKIVREDFLREHEALLSEMRLQMHFKNPKGIEEVGWKIHILRKEYRTRFAA